jgi:hypothetical protein
MVEGALRDALNEDSESSEPTQTSQPATNTLLGDMNESSLKSGKLKVVKIDD